MINKPLKLMEYLWLVLSAITAGLFIYELIRSGFSNAYILLIFSVVSLLMYFWRKSLREKEEKDDY